MAAKKKAAKKKVAKKKSKRKPNAAFMKALTPSAALSAVVGSKALARTEAVKKIWAYIKSNHSMQDQSHHRVVRYPI